MGTGEFRLLPVGALRTDRKQMTEFQGPTSLRYDLFAVTILKHHPDLIATSKPDDDDESNLTLLLVQGAFLDSNPLDLLILSMNCWI